MGFPGFIQHIFFTDRRHHLISNFIRSFRPDINQFIITLTRGDQTIVYLSFNFANFIVRFFNQPGFGFRNFKIVNPDRNTGLSCNLIPQILDPVGEDN